MATVETQRLSADEFWEWANRPENGGKLFELERGEVVEMPSPGERHGALCVWIGHLLWNYVIRRGAGGVCSNDTGLLVEQAPDTVRGPDVMLFGESRSLEQLSPKYSTRVPQLVVEVLSPSDQMTKVNRRIKQYLRRGIPLVWLVDPEVRSVSVYRPGKELLVLDETEELVGEEVLVDFRLPVAELFTLPGQGPAEAQP
jgi:Uma2 family endonuclease